MSVRNDLWTPPDVGENLVLLVGHWWDAVSTPTTVGIRALELLGTASGAVIQDDSHGKLYWLIGVDTARNWCLSEARVLTTRADESTFLTVPPASWAADRDLYWRVPVGPGRYLTNTQRLHEALDQAINENHVHVAGGTTRPTRPGDDATPHQGKWWTAYRYLGGAS